jgi:hypothetical protein
MKTKSALATRLPPKLAAADRSLPEFWLPQLQSASDQFEQSLRSSLSKAIDLGKQLIAAKEALPHGEFGKLFSDHKQPVAGALGMNARWAQKVMLMASNPAIANASYKTHLPANLDAVYDLACMTAPALTAAIESGKVRPGMTRQEAKALKQEAAGKAVALKREKQPACDDVLPYDPETEVIEKQAEWGLWLLNFLAKHPSRRIRVSAQLLVQHLQNIVGEVE